MALGCIINTVCQRKKEPRKCLKYRVMISNISGRFVEKILKQLEQGLKLDTAESEQNVIYVRNIMTGCSVAKAP